MRQTRIRGPRRQSGFTLIEVLIAMTLLSIMVVLLFASLRICAQSWEQGENKITEVNEVAVVYNFFQRHLVPAIPLWDDFTKKDERTFSFQGKKQSLQFVSSFPASAGRSGMQLFSIEQRQDDDDQLIEVTLTPFFPATEGEQWHREEVVLLKHVRDFSLSYYGVADDGGGENSWQDEWLEKESQPLLVKISIDTDNGVFWPEMIIALKITDGAVGTDDLGNTAVDESEPAEERN